MKSLQKVSIIMPAYNAANYIEDAIESVLAQTFSNFELLVIDDCSDDNTVEIVNGYIIRDKRIRIINLPTNMGAPAGPRNIGIRQSSAQWIAFLDADDIWHPAKIQRQIEVLERTGSRFCSTKMVDFIDQSNLILRDAGPDDYEWITFSQQLIKFRTPTSSVIVERALLMNNFFNENPLFKAREDLDCWLHCHEEIGRSVKITVPMTGYRLIQGQISKNKLEMMGRHLHVLQKYRYISGKRLGLMAWVFTFTHFMISLYSRLIKKQL